MSDEVEYPQILASKLAPNGDQLSIAVPQHMRRAVELLEGFVMSPDATFEQKRQALQFTDEKTSGDSERGDNYVGRVLWVTEVYQHRARVNVTKNGGPQVRTIDTHTGEVILSNYEDARRTVLHVIAIESRLLKEPKKIGFVGRSVEWYFSDKIIPLFGLKFEQPLPFVFTKTQSGAYSIESPAWAQFPRGE